MPEANWKKAGSKSPDRTERHGRRNLLTLRIQLKNQYKNLKAKLDLQTQLPLSGSLSVRSVKDK